jgi:hypothetical protein
MDIECAPGLRFRDVFDPADWPERERETHLVAGLLSTTLSVLAADPAAGKTNYAVGLAAALLNGEPDFLGQEVLRELDSVAFISTDADGANSVRRRIGPLVNVPSRKRVWASDYPTAGLVGWEDVIGQVRALRPELLIVDNVPGLVQDINDFGEAKTFTRPLLGLTERGIAVLLLTHTSEPGMKGPAQGINAPMGTRYWTIPARVKSSLSGRESDQRKRVKAHNNDGQLVQIDAFLDVARGAPVWSLCTGESNPRQQREAQSPAVDVWKTLADRVVTEQPADVESLRALGKHYAESMGMSVDTVRSRLGDLVHWTGTGWARTP